jgi:hypothetical protein
MYKYISGFYPREPIHVYVSCTAMCAYFWLNCCGSFGKPTKQISPHRRWGLWISQFFFLQCTAQLVWVSTEFVTALPATRKVFSTLQTMYVHSNLSENSSILYDNVLLCMYVCISWHYTCHLTIATTLSLQCTRGLLMFLEQCTCCYSRWGWSFPPGCPCGRTPRMVSRNLANSKSFISVHLSWSQI